MALKVSDVAAKCVPRYLRIIFLQSQLYPIDFTCGSLGGTAASQLRIATKTGLGPEYPRHCQDEIEHGQ